MGTTGYERFAVLFLLSLAGIIIALAVGVASVAWLLAIKTPASIALASLIAWLFYKRWTRYD